ncbi:MAG: hypothetical protein JNM93_11560 [Bacteriovoracaceae bacterium]|nr:hypothetical protein [Bacteriovoracaceae bacterium]
MTLKSSQYYSVEEYTFDTLGGNTGFQTKIEPYQLQEVGGEILHREKPSANVIRKEREAAQKNAFKVDKVVSEYRGLKKQEIEDFQRNINSEVDKKLRSVQDDTYKRAYEEGLKKGHDQAYQEASQAFEKQIDQIQKIIEELQEDKKKVLQQNIDNAYEMIRALSKWVILKEVENQDYLRALLEKLILEMGVKDNLLIRVSKNSFARMPQVIEQVEKKLGQLTNVRVELEHEMNMPGIILESQSSILDGSVRAQLNAIDEVFKTVGLPPKEIKEDSGNES